jgi:hypothetical protein
MATTLRECLTHQEPDDFGGSLFFGWSYYSARCSNLLAEGIKNTCFGRSSWIDFLNGINIDSAAIHFVAGANYGITPVCCVLFRACCQVQFELLALTSKWGVSGYTVSLHGPADLWMRLKRAGAGRGA